MSSPTPLQQYLVTAYDHTDAQALERRLAAREAHLEQVRKLKANGNFREGGAILNEAGQMIGSALIVAFATKDELNEWLTNDTYVVGNVWNQIEVKPFRCAVL